jgi:hypothetical protein
MDPHVETAADKLAHLQRVLQEKKNPENNNTNTPWTSQLLHTITLKYFAMHKFTCTYFNYINYLAAYKVK